MAGSSGTGSSGYGALTPRSCHALKYYANCRLCFGMKGGDSILLCDQCDRGFHPHCLVPPLAQIPDGDWLCARCIRFDTAKQVHDELGELRAVGVAAHLAHDLRRVPLKRRWGTVAQNTHELTQTSPKQRTSRIKAAAALFVQQLGVAQVCKQLLELPAKTVAQLVKRTEEVHAQAQAQAQAQTKIRRQAAAASTKARPNEKASEGRKGSGATPQQQARKNAIAPNQEKTLSGDLPGALGRVLTGEKRDSTAEDINQAALNSEPTQDTGTKKKRLKPARVNMNSLPLARDSPAAVIPVTLSGNSSVVIQGKMHASQPIAQVQQPNVYASFLTERDPMQRPLRLEQTVKAMGPLADFREAQRTDPAAYPLLHGGPDNRWPFESGDKPASSASGRLDPPQEPARNAAIGLTQASGRDAMYPSHMATTVGGASIAPNRLHQKPPQGWFQPGAAQANVTLYPHGVPNPITVSQGMSEHVSPLRPVHTPSGGSNSMPIHHHAEVGASGAVVDPVFSASNRSGGDAFAADIPSRYIRASVPGIIEGHSLHHGSLFPQTSIPMNLVSHSQDQARRSTGFGLNHRSGLSAGSASAKALDGTRLEQQQSWWTREHAAGLENAPARLAPGQGYPTVSPLNSSTAAHSSSSYAGRFSPGPGVTYFHELGSEPFEQQESFNQYRASRAGDYFATSSVPSGWTAQGQLPRVSGLSDGDRVRLPPTDEYAQMLALAGPASGLASRSGATRAGEPEWYGRGLGGPYELGGGPAVGPSTNSFAMIGGSGARTAEYGGQHPPSHQHLQPRLFGDSWTPRANGSSALWSGQQMSSFGLGPDTRPGTGQGATFSALWPPQNVGSSGDGNRANAGLYGDGVHPPPQQGGLGPQPGTDSPFLPPQQMQYSQQAPPRAHLYRPWEQ
ncbi:Methyl-CpG-binding domain-containing protein 9 [Porphyridium purpureum]|uniref:Methyl-CpG-binding domain-containing protein 9 n=1 Tax=Porphyridium purpureum TaxID=35688 RepID=A0A5J4Z5G0_PORPP|nr:Methyl-CpG-binding domain-containing protein 9 [Porphyridium purpureum]|eukprot:POR6913..scf295_1